MKKVYLGFLLAFVFWFIMFSPMTKDYVNFWLLMILSTFFLTAYSFYFDANQIKKLLHFNMKWIFVGITSAILLYLFFYIGYLISYNLFDFTQQQISGIYSTKNQSNKLFIATALLLWIGPAEELFWRGFAQSNLSLKFNETKAYLITTLIYAFVHIWALNFMLFMAALVCGFFWGWMFKKYQTLTPVIISHSIWDFLIFVVLPIQ